MALKKMRKQTSIDWKMKMVDPQMACMKNALSDLNRAVRTVEGQYRNADLDIEQAIRDLRKAMVTLTYAVNKGSRGVACIDDYVNAIHPDFVSVNNGHGMTRGTTAVKSVKAEVDVDGVHMYVDIDE